MRVFHTRGKAVSSRRVSHCLPGIPKPTRRRHVRLRTVFDDRATRPPAFREVFFERQRRQAARRKQPAVIRHDAHRSPTRFQQVDDALKNVLQLFLDLSRESRLQLVAERVELAMLGPCAGVLAGGQPCFQTVQHLMSRRGNRVAQSLRRHQPFPLRDDRAEIRPCLFAHHREGGRCHRWLGRRRHGRQCRPPVTPTHEQLPFVRFGEKPLRHVKPKPVHEQ